MNDPVKLEQETLPTKEEFNNLLRNEECSDEDYARAQKVWTVFDCKKFEDYHTLYLKSMSSSKKY